MLARFETSAKFTPSAIVGVGAAIAILAIKPKDGIFHVERNVQEYLK